MAKLSAHGKEVWRGVRYWKNSDGTNNRETVALMDDRWMLSNRAYQQENGKWHSFGWVRKQQVPPQYGIIWQVPELLKKQMGFADA